MGHLVVASVRKDKDRFDCIMCFLWTRLMVCFFPREYWGTLEHQNVHCLSLCGVASKLKWRYLGPKADEATSFWTDGFSHGCGCGCGGKLVCRHKPSVPILSIATVIGTSLLQYGGFYVPYSSFETSYCSFAFTFLTSYPKTQLPEMTFLNFICPPFALTALRVTPWISFW